MDEKTEELRDIFIETTGGDTVTERQEETHGSLADADDDAAVTARLHELVGTMRERYEFDTGLGDDALVRVVRGFYDGTSDADVAAELDVDADAVFTARMDLHLVRESDRDAPFELEDLRSLLVEDADPATAAAELGVDVATVESYWPVATAEVEATRANDRFRDEFADLLTDSDLQTRHAADAREDGLREATEDIETDVSF